MQATNYWMTFTRADDKFVEEISIRATLRLSEDHTTGQCEVPYFGIRIENDVRAFQIAIRATQEMLIKDRGHGALHRGVVTQATYSETRDALIAGRDAPCFTREEYEEANRKCLQHGRELDLQLM